MKSEVGPTEVLELIKENFTDIVVIQDGKHEYDVEKFVYVMGSANRLEIHVASITRQTKARRKVIDAE